MTVQRSTPKRRRKGRQPAADTRGLRRRQRARRAARRRLDHDRRIRRCERAWREAAATNAAASTYLDANERSIQPVTDNAGYVDAMERGTVASTPTVVSATSTGSEFDCTQLGIGIALGIALALGLLLAFRGLRQRPLAH